jgi:hypothetical protein
MASGVIVGTKYISGGHYWIELHWSNSTVSSTQSDTIVKTYFCSDWAVNFSASKSGSTSVNGSNLSWSSGADVSHGSSLEKTLIYTRSAVRTTHNADGTKSITISGTYTPNVTISGYGTLGTMSASGTAVLNDVNGTVINPNTWVWTGSSWVRGSACRVWNGDSWVQIDLMKAWSGGGWYNTQ